MLSNFGRADGGRETWAYNFIPRLLAAYPGLRLRIVGLRIDGERDNERELLASVAESDRARLEIQFVRARANRVPNAIYFWRGLWRLGRDRDRARRPSLTLAVGSFVDLLGILVSADLRKSPKVLWLRSIFADEKAHRIPGILRPLLQKLEVSVLHRADLLIGNGEDTADHYRGVGLDVVVIKNAVELKRWEMSPAPMSMPLDIAYIGRLSKVKGIDEFVAVARLAARHDGSASRFNFHVVGDGPDGAEVVAADAAGELRFHGALPNADVPGFVEGMDVCVALGFAGGAPGSGGGSGISNALIEQMAAGRVLVCWDNRAYRQILDDDCAYLVPQGDVGALLQAFEQIAANPDQARAKAKKGAALAAAYDFAGHMESFGRVAGRWLC